MSTFGERLTYARKKAGFTQGDIANHFNITASSVSQWEKGDTQPSTTKFSELAGVLGVSVDWLMNGELNEVAYMRARLAPSDNQAPAPQRQPLPATLQAIPLSVPVRCVHTINGNGFFKLEDEIVDYVCRPRGLMGASDTYAFRFLGHDMDPQYKYGELVFVHPHRPIHAGDAIIVATEDEEKTRVGELRNLIERADSSLICEQLKPHKREAVNREKIIFAHKILTTSEVFGV